MLFSGIFNKKSRFFPPFNDRHFIASDRIFTSDRLFHALGLRYVPDWIQPNHITLFRIIATPPTLLLLLDRHYEWGVPIFLAVALTDAADGALARTRGKITQWGMMFDPLADKFLIVPVLIVLMVNAVSLPIALTVIGIELLIVIFAVFWRKQGNTIQSNFWGKWKMILHVVAIMAILLSIWFSIPLLAVANILLVASIICALLSLMRKGI